MDRIAIGQSVAMDRDRGGRIPLHYVAFEGTPDDVQAEVCRGTDVNDRDARGWTPLHFAAEHQRADNVDVLLGLGADTTARDATVGNTALHRAVMTSRGEGATILALLHGGADPDRPNDLGESPRDWAERIANYDVKQYLGPQA